MTGIDTGRTRWTAFMLLGAALAICAIVLLICPPDDSYAEGGECGADLHWDYQDGTLTITGTGPMDVWNTEDAVPWNAHRGDITAVSVGNQVTTVGNYAFKQCQMTNFVIPDSVTTLGKDCFAGCDQMTHFTIGSGVTNFSGEMMLGCTSMRIATIVGDHYAKHETHDAGVYTSDLKTLLYYPAGIDVDDAFVYEGVERIASYSFANSKCFELNDYDTVKVFEDRAFYNSRFSNMEFGPDVEYVGSELFGEGEPDLTFHLDFKGTLKSDFTSKEFYNYDDTKCTDIPKDLLGKKFSIDYYVGNQYSVIWAALSIKYLFTDGSEAAPRYYEMMGGGVQYERGSPDVEGYTPDIPVVSGKSDGTVRDVTVTYSNKQFEVVYNYNGKEVMKSMEYFGHTVEVKPYEKGHVSVDDWHTINVKVENGKFVMPEQNVYFTNLPIGADGIMPSEREEAPESMEIGLAAAVIVIAAAMLLLTLRRH